MKYVRILCEVRVRKQVKSLNQKRRNKNMKSDATVKRADSQDENLPLDSSGIGAAVEKEAATTTTSQNGAASADQDGEVGLKAKMSLLNGCTVIVGSIIGSGIFVSPTGVLMHTGSVNMALIVWVISGLFSMVSHQFYSFIFCVDQQKERSRKAKELRTEEIYIHYIVFFV